MTTFCSTEIMLRLHERFTRLYGADASKRCMNRMAALIGRYSVGPDCAPPGPGWDQTDAVLITYADMVRDAESTPLSALNRFMDQHLKGAIGCAHILPFFPYSSDDGFSVIDYRKVKPESGTWDDIHQLGQHVDLMFDLVLNHVSRGSGWFRDFVSGIAPARDYFIALEPGTDLSAVVRPRNHPLLSQTQTRNGERFVWTTFSDDQIDVDFRNPDVLFEFLDIILLYVSMGARILRLDAIAYLWKEVGTTCIHLPETHEVVKLFRDVLSMVAPRVLILTETNVPHSENISYFGQGDEAHMVYQFTLPPLLLHALQTGRSDFLTRWAAALPAPPSGCTFFNFTASHDGIGVRPLEGILPDEEIERVLEGVRARKGFISTKRNTDGTESPYELNITYYSALSDPARPDEELHVRRFLCSQTIPLALRGVPAVYFNSLLAAPNDQGGVDFTGQARTINRTKWDASDLAQLLGDPESPAARVMTGLSALLRLRARQPAFHPDGPQTVQDLGDKVFAVDRTAPDGTQRIIAISNVTASKTATMVRGRIPGMGTTNQWKDLIKGRTRGGNDGSLRLAPYETVWLVAPSGTR